MMDVLTWPPNFAVGEATYRDVSECFSEAREYFSQMGGDLSCIARWSTPNGMVVAFRTGKAREKAA